MSCECLIDFLDPRLSESCEISTDGVSDDYYSLQNLIAADLSKRNLGFMAFQVSKPPIEIKIKFKWKIDLKLIKIYSELLSLKSTKFQVFIKCPGPEGHEIERKIGDVLLAESQIGFCLKAGEVDVAIEDSMKTDAIYNYARKSIHAVDFLKIVIQDSRLRRAPVLKKIEVWGFPSRKNSKDELATINRLMEPVQQHATKTGAVNQKRSEVLTFTIPEDYLDAITQELLVMPFILPSGNVIDSTTIEKHNRHEETYGRLPSDPFTGLIFTSESQPKFNESLKTRLDQFKLRNSHEIDVKKSGRTLGRKAVPMPSTSGYSTSGHVSKKIKLNGNSSSDLDSLISSIYENNQVSIFTRPKETRTKPPNSCDSTTCETKTSPAFYQISLCNHVFCKPCLLLLKSVCGVCETNFASENVQKKNF